MPRPSTKIFGRLVALGATLLLAATSLSACATAACPAAAVADNFLITTTSTTRTHPLLSICESTTCTHPVNASSADRGRALEATPRLALSATAVNHWRVSVLETKSGTTATDPTSVRIELFDQTARIARRTLHLTWYPAPGACSNFKTADTVHLALP